MTVPPNDWGESHLRRIPGPIGPLEGAVIPVPGGRDVVVIVPGSGPTDRDGNGPVFGLASDSYRLLAEGLAARGVASIRIDKRGMFGSRGAVTDGNRVTLNDYADDLCRWGDEAATLAPRVWLAGHSEGGVVALIAAVADRLPLALCGVILLATPGRRLGQVIRAQLRANPANAALLAEAETVLAELEAGRGVDDATVSEPLRPLFRAAVQPFLIDTLPRDPSRIAEDWRGPALIVQGDADLQVTPADADRLVQAMPQAHRLDLPKATHMLKSDVPGQPLASYTDPSLPLHPGLIDGIVTFLGN